MQVIRHEAVGKNFKLMLGGRLRNLLEQFADDPGIDKDVGTSPNAKRQ